MRHISRKKISADFPLAFRRRRFIRTYIHTPASALSVHCTSSYFLHKLCYSTIRTARASTFICSYYSPTCTCTYILHVRIRERTISSIACLDFSILIRPMVRTYFGPNTSILVHRKILLIGPILARNQEEFLRM